MKLKKFDLNIKIPIYTRLGKSVLSLFYWTNKWNVRGSNNYLSILKKNKSVLICCWHSQLLSIVKNLSGFNYHAIAGTHKDAEIISRIARAWGINMIRGSNKEKGAKAYKKIINVLKNPPSLLFITPDGPSGPPRIPKLGIIRAAQITGTPIIPVTSFSTKRWSFNNWDTFYAEKPFGKIYIEYGQPLYFDKNKDQNECSNLLIDAMDELENNNLQYANNENK